MIEIEELRRSFPGLQSITPLAESGQRHVLRAVRDNQPVVLKILKPTQDPELARRELEAIVRLDCDYVPRILESGTTTVGSTARLYVIEPYIQGESYDVRLRREPQPPLPLVLDLAETLLKGCADFAASGLVHRDLKPGNILLDEGGKIWIIDFGIVRVLDAVSLTPTNQQFGKFTLGYGAPEQMRNLKRQIDCRSDLFSVGVILYESLCGYHPYYQGTSDPFEVMRRITGADLPELEVREAPLLGSLVMSLASRFPSRRPQTPAQALDRFAEATRGLNRGGR